MNRLVATIALLLLPACLFAQSNIYSSWPNFPQNSNFFPLVVWLQGPTGSLGSNAPYPNVAAAMKATKMNVLLAIDGGNSGGGWPSAFGVDCGASGNCGQFAALVQNGIYLIPTVSYTDNTSANSIASVQAVATSLNASQYLIGYNLGDEPWCTQNTAQGPAMSSLGTLIPQLQTYDSTRPFFLNFTDFVFGHGACWPTNNPTNISALQAISVGSFDVYPVTGPWNGNSNIPVVAGQAQDSMWINGWTVAQMVAWGRANQPIWAYVDPGDNELGYPMGNGSVCTQSTNLCTPDNHEYRATAEQVSAEIWMSLINGAMGIEYFCHDTSLATGLTSYNFCLGSTTSGEGAVAAAIASNLTYVNTTILSFAPQLNSPVLGRCTMNRNSGVGTGTIPVYNDFNTSCTNGILTMSTGAASVPGSAIVKNYNGTAYLFADSDRNGQATMTFTLTGYSGATVTVVYDSNAQYDPAHSSVGTKFTLDANGRFSDTFGANGHNYQPKIYSITPGGPAAPTGLTATVQ